METCDVYCSACDATVRVTLDPAADHPLAGARLECLDRDPSCARVECPIERATARELGALLEFLPPEAREFVGTEGAETDPEAILRRGRIQAMRRGHDPVP